MNRIVLFLIFFIVTTPLFKAQAVQIAPYNTGWLPVDTYDGTRVNNLIQIPIHLSSSQGFQMNQWTLSFRVIGPITNGTQTISAADIGKLKFQINSVTSQGSPNANDNNQIANAGTLGLITAKIPFSTALTNFVANSSYDLTIRNRYFQINLGYAVEIEGGAYLEQYKSWDNYRVNLALEIRNRKNEILPTGQPSLISFDMRIMPPGIPPGSEQFSLLLAPAATNVQLEFQTPSDYANGVSKTQIKAASIISNTPYFVQVHTLSSELSSPSNTLSFNTVKLSMADNLTGLYSPGVNLSPTNQVLYSNSAHTISKWYDLKYEITPPTGPIGFFNKPYETYSGTVIFTITPQ